MSRGLLAAGSATSGRRSAGLATRRISSRPRIAPAVCAPSANLASAISADAVRRVPSVARIARIRSEPVHDLGGAERGAMDAAAIAQVALPRRLHRDIADDGPGRAELDARDRRLPGFGPCARHDRAEPEMLGAGGEMDARQDAV